MRTRQTDRTRTAGSRDADKNFVVQRHERLESGNFAGHARGVGEVPFRLDNPIPVKPDLCQRQRFEGDADGAFRRGDYDFGQPLVLRANFTAV